MSETKSRPIRTILISLATVLIIGSVTLSLLPLQSRQQANPTSSPENSTPTATAIPPEILADLSQAEQAMNDKNYQRAAVAYSNVLASMPDHVDSYIKRSTAYKALGFYQQAEEDVSKEHYQY